MNREPLGLYLFRFFTGLLLLVFLIMLYWSSTLIEERVASIGKELEQMRAGLTQIEADTSAVKARIEQGGVPVLSKSSIAEPITVSRHAENKNNLLEPDPFYLKTLPDILGAGFKPQGTFHRASIAKPDNLHPFSNWAEVNEWRALCSGSVAQNQIGFYEKFTPNFAYKVEERNAGTPNHEFWVFLRDDIYWQPLTSALFDGDVELAPQFLKKHPVTAYDFKFYFDAIMNPFVQEGGALALRNYIGDIKDIEVIDEKTFVVRWRSHDIDGEPRILYKARMWTMALKPLASWVYQYFPDGTKILEDDADIDAYRTSSLWAQNFSNHWAKNIIVSCGPWIFEGMNDERIKFRRNPDYFNPLAALAEEVSVRFKNSPDTVWQDFKSNRLDSYSLQPDQLLELDNFLTSNQYSSQEAKGNGIERLDYVGRSYSYIGWNQARAIFQSAKVRRALTMSIDRERIIKQNLNGMAIPINGTFFRYSKAYDESLPLIPYDPEKAKLLLAEEGWYDSDGDGIIDKEINGQRIPFRFYLTYYVKNPTTKSICDYVSTALREVGIDCRMKGVDIADLSAVFEDKNFDALFLAWGLGTPPEDPKQLWYSAGAKERGSSNAVGFVNKRADEIIQQLEFENNSEKRIRLYHEFSRIIYEEQPYTFLYTPKVIMLYRDYLRNVFIPKDRQDLIPNADVAEPDSSIFYIQQRG